MPAWLAPAIGAVAGFVGGERSNKINQQEAEKNRNWQTREADKNRGFQERMRNTEWQAAIADMHAAGINPAVAYSQGGASSPGGSMGGGATAASAENTAASAFQAAQQSKALKLLDQQIIKTRAEARSAESQELIDGLTSHYLRTIPADGKGSLLRQQIEQAVRGARVVNDLNQNRADMIGPQSAIMQQIERALQPILSGLSNAGGAAMNRLKELRK